MNPPDGGTSVEEMNIDGTARVAMTLLRRLCVAKCASMTDVQTYRQNNEIVGPGDDDR
jgi:hypothetical protein